MLLLFPCPGTFPAPSCQKSCCMPLSSGCAAAASSCLSTTPTTALRRSQRGPRSFTIRARFQDGIVPISRLKACTEADTTPCSLRRCGRPSGKRLGCPAATRCVLFSDLLASLPSSSRALPRGGPGTFFQSQTGILYALDRWRHPSLHSSSTSTVSSHRLRLDQNSGGALWRPGYTPG